MGVQPRDLDGVDAVQPVPALRRTVLLAALDQHLLARLSGVRRQVAQAVGARTGGTGRGRRLKKVGRRQDRGSYGASRGSIASSKVSGPGGSEDRGGLKSTRYMSRCPYGTSCGIASNSMVMPNWPGWAHIGLDPCPLRATDRECAVAFLAQCRPQPTLRLFRHAPKPNAHTGNETTLASTPALSPAGTS